MTDEDINLQDIDELEGEPQLYEHFRFVVDSGQEPLRIDKYMLEKLQHSSRNRIQRAADAGFVHVNDRPVKRNYRVRPGDVVTLMLDRPRHDTSIEAEDIPLDVVYEDSQLMVVNKPAGLVVHPGVGNFTGTLVNALAWHLRDVEGYDPNDPEVGLVHRIDKDTSGLLMVAKTDRAHNALSAQLAQHSITRRYKAIVYSNIKEDEGTVDKPIGRDPGNRLRNAVVYTNSKNAVTHYRVLERFGGFTLVEAVLETGRTHQIRVHMAYIRHPLLGDTLYGPAKNRYGAKRQMLHAGVLGFVHPVTGEYMEFNSPLPQDFEDVLAKLRK